VLALLSSNECSGGKVMGRWRYSNGGGGGGHTLDSGVRVGGKAGAGNTSDIDSLEF
jgi:hypothetical protein